MNMLTRPLPTAVLVVTLLTLTINRVRSQDITFEGRDVKLSKSSTAELQKNFKNYRLFEYAPQPLKDIDDKGHLDIQLKIPGYINSEISLTRTEMLSARYVSSHHDPTHTSTPVPTFRTYKGYIKGDPTSAIRVSISEGQLHGYIQTGTTKLWIDKANTFDASLPPTVLVAHHEKDIITTNAHTCAATEVQQQVSKISKQHKADITCLNVDLAIAMDYGYITHPSHNSFDLARNKTMHIMNLVEGNYQDQFSADIHFEIVEHFAPSSLDNSNSLWGTGQNIVEVLDRFTAWAPNGFVEPHDLGQFWTTRDLYFLDVNTQTQNYSVTGLAWINVVCNDLRYHVLESYSSTDWHLRQLTAHEIGHNFGAGHDDDLQYIMYPSVGQNSNTFSPLSRSVINSNLPRYTCLEDCSFNSCTRVTSIRPYNCSAGTYQLDLTISHGGGGTSTAGFDVIIDGNRYPFMWQSSPQSVTISHLPADGAQNKQITLAAKDMSDTGCNAIDTYNAPNANCEISIKEDFDDCQLPVGWISQTTNSQSDPPYAWRVGDASRFINNYGAHSNATSPKTINGTCMVYMDDDLYNPWTGVATLVTPALDGGDFQSLSLRMDYIFNKFTTGKDPNNSSFKIHVWNGSQYVNIYSDTNDYCPWDNVWQANCIEQVNVNLTPYLNDNLHLTLVYEDMNAWAGMAVFDNFVLNATLRRQDCPSSVILTPGRATGTFAARDSIVTSGSIVFDAITTLSAPSVLLKPEVEVASQIELTVTTSGCTNNAN